MSNRKFAKLFLSLVLAAAFPKNDAAGGQVAVRYTEGIVHGFLVLREMSGRILAEGDIAQTAKDGLVTSHLTIHFKDGSLYEDTTTFSQRGKFRLLKDHVVQKGPAFKTQMETTIDAHAGKVAVHAEKDGKPQELSQNMQLPPDLSNGMAFVLIKNILSSEETTLSYLAFLPKPTLVKLVFSRQGEEKLKAGSTSQPGVHFVMKVKIDGIKGVVASVLKKEPPDTHMWVLDNGVPTFVGSEGPLFEDGPVLRIELVSPSRDLRSTTSDGDSR